ncbi:MAG TPA: hypothetical protein P5148_06935 [Anaerolineae bacterium]|nr:hypothetical protein [Anaerolineae bacterium]
MSTTFEDCQPGSNLATAGKDKKSLAEYAAWCYNSATVDHFIY